MPDSLNEDEGEIHELDDFDVSPSPRTGSIANLDVTTRPIPAEVLQIWRQLPEAIRLDPSLALFQKEFEKVQKSHSLGNAPANECSVVNIFSSNRITPENSCQEKDKYKHDKLNSHETKLGRVIKYSKVSLLVCCWIAFFIILMTTKEKVENVHLVSVPNYAVKNITLANGDVPVDRISVTVEGALLPDEKVNTSSYYNLPFSSLSIWLELLADKETYSDGRSLGNNQLAKNISEVWILPLLPEEMADQYPNQRRTKTFELEYYPEKLEHRPIAINLKTDSNFTVPLSISYDLSPIDTDKGLALGACVLIGLYIIIIFELINRTIAALLAAVSSIAILAAMNEKPTASEITSWIDVDTLMLLFSMMVLVAIVADTGAFDYFAAYAYKITGGKVLPLVSTLCFFTAFVSAFLDNVTVILLITPVTIRLCELVQLDPVPVLTLMVMFSNVGGAMTPVGDPPNVIIASNRRVIAAGVGFTTFTLHMGIGVLLVLGIVYGHFRFIFRNLEVMGLPKPREESRHDIAIWQRAVDTLSSYTENVNFDRDILLKKVKEVLQQLESKPTIGNNSLENYQSTLEELKEKYLIRDKWLLAKSGFCMALVIVLFFLHSSPNFHLSIGFTTFICVLLLLILADNKNFDGMLERVEWSTLLFFAALFVLMEALTQLGLISWIGNKTELIIMSVGEESRLAVAILLLLWVSSIAGAFVDNVPLATMMIRIVTGLAENNKLKLPLQPLVWALAFGACMGGNGTLIGATTNVVCAGVAEQHGYRVTFMQFFKMGFPVLLTSTLTISVYLMIAHVIFEWNY